MHYLTRQHREQFCQQLVHVESNGTGSSSQHQQHKSRAVDTQVVHHSSGLSNAANLEATTPDTTVE
eukprot:m.112545 g.112545  ORF g.112545 m.112545 type:complete len:66 (+) comp15412_c0_seq4:1367-1564(+)